MPTAPRQKHWLDMHWSPSVRRSVFGSSPRLLVSSLAVSARDLVDHMMIRSFASQRSLRRFLPSVLPHEKDDFLNNKPPKTFWPKPSLPHLWSMIDQRHRPILRAFSIGHLMITMGALWVCQGCQWRAPSPLVHAHLSRIVVERIDEPQGQWTRQRLHHVLGGPGTQPPLYRLTLECQSSTKPWALNRHGQTMWSYMSLNTAYTLKTCPQGRVIASGHLRLSGSLPVTAPYYSDTISQETMDYRLRERLVQQLYSRLTALMTRYVKRTGVVSNPIPSSNPAPDLVTTSTPTSTPVNRKPLMPDTPS